MKRPDLANELKERQERDQTARHRMLESRLPEDSAAVRAIDVDNTAWLRAVVSEHGWPGVDLVGEEGADAAWLITQHADHDTQFQHRALELLTHAALAGDVPARHFAYLTDRIRVADGRAQVYGTQYEQDGAGNVVGPYLVEGPERLDERRSALGLEPQDVYERQLRAHA
ncbi:hypothetical protein BFF78_36380 [Streptomyces fodineus]|uniref:Uncharacterized protein n=1 Tax=Streptomyces fodineus TaxID=1904616 RepID=A0A1D7YJV5_9ACTN|nr:hypothetical protein BFF78_36380 [Streptomyces fodineus]